MLGKLFSTAASTLTSRTSTSGSSRLTTSLESVQEDIHTRNLLFPDAEALYEHQHDQVFPLSSSTVPHGTSTTNPFDVNPDIELELRDVRVVIMQEATSLSNSAALLYDSHPLIKPPPSADRQAQAVACPINAQRGSGRSITSPRRISLGGQASKPVIITHEGSVPRNFGAFDRYPSAHARTASYAETDGQRSAREYREEMMTFSNCIFGSSDIMAYKGTGTKVHIIPIESKSAPFPFGDGHGSLGRSSLRSSKLAQSFTSEKIMQGHSSLGLSAAGPGSRSLDKKRVLITRIFPITLTNNEGDDAESMPTSHSELPDVAGSYGFPKANTDGKTQPTKKPRQKRTPMYAIGLIVHLPSTTNLTWMPASRSVFRGPSSYTEQVSCPSSFSSSKVAGWTVLGNGFGNDSLESSVLSDFDDRIDVITQHWDIIIRTLSQLQAVVSTTVLAQLKQADLSSPEPANLRGVSSNLRTPVASISISGKRVDETSKLFKGPGTNAKVVQLLPNALAYQQNIRTEVDDARQRIVSGIKTLQVVTRQGRWGIWREEARWVDKWAGGKEEGFFFYNILAAFLGNHTEWLKALGPEMYRRYHYQQQRASKDEDSTIVARTVIIAQDKMAARRLIFLLSAFLPPTQRQQSPFARLHRPSTAASFDAYSQSPPSYLPTVVREESLRRKVKRRHNPPRSTHSRSMSFQTQNSNASGTSPLGSNKDIERPSGDTTSLKTANLPIPGNECGSRKSSAATTTTVTPATTIPHFSTRRPIKVGTGGMARPGSSGSLAADDLIRSLKRTSSTGYYSTASSEMQGNSRWGSVISGFWSTKRRESTDITPPSAQNSEVEDANADMKRGKLAEMVEEAQRQQKPVRNLGDTAPSDKALGTSVSYATPEPTGKGYHIQEPRPIHPAGAYESPVKTSINEKDGVIDIDVPLPDFITSSFGSTISSPSSSGYLSTHAFGPGLEGFEHYSRSGPDNDVPLNVGGWIPRYHPDFVLQAVPVQERLEEEIRASMRAEPTPAITPASHDETSRWVDISSALIADSTNFTVKRIRYRRHIQFKTATDVRDSENTFHAKIPSMYGNPYGVTSQTVGIYSVTEDTFIEDMIIGMDETLTEAVERMISQSDSSSGSGSSSRSTSRYRSREGSDSTATGIPYSGISHAGAPEPLTVPKAHVGVSRSECKKVILGALEEIARQVAEARQEETVLTPHTREKELERNDSVLREGVRNWLTSVEELG